MYILNSDQTLPVKNIKFDNIKGLYIYIIYNIYFSLIF